MLVANVGSPLQQMDIEQEVRARRRQLPYRAYAVQLYGILSCDKQQPHNPYYEHVPHASSGNGTIVSSLGSAG